MIELPTPTVEETIIVIPDDDDEENQIELSDLYDETPEENLVLTYINENFQRK
jgi:hypothetical protein